MGQPFTQIRQCSITPVSLWRTRREKTSAHGSSTPRIWKGCARSAMRVSRAASLLNLSNERLEKTVTIGGFLSATIPSRRPGAYYSLVRDGDRYRGSQASRGEH